MCGQVSLHPCQGGVVMRAEVCVCVCALYLYICKESFLLFGKVHTNVKIVHLSVYLFSIYSVFIQSFIQYLCNIKDTT